MSQKSVEILLGKLVTDEELGHRFRVDPGRNGGFADRGPQSPRPPGPVARSAASEGRASRSQGDRKMTRALLGIALVLSLAACGKDEKNPNLLTASGHVEATDVHISSK